MKPTIFVVYMFAIFATERLEVPCTLRFPVTKTFVVVNELLTDKLVSRPTEVMFG